MKTPNDFPPGAIVKGSIGKGGSIYFLIVEDRSSNRHAAITISNRYAASSVYYEFQVKMAPHTPTTLLAEWREATNLEQVCQIEELFRDYE